MMCYVSNIGLFPNSSNLIYDTVLCNNYKFSFGKKNQVITKFNFLLKKCLLFYL